MIGSLRGTVAHKRINSLLLDVGGVGYQVMVPTRVAESALLDTELQLFTHLAVREDALTLYGFSTDEAKDLFELLVGVSGIGPKIALGILSTYSPDEVQSAVSSGNAAAFSAVSGIGKKNAERIVLELKNKVWSAAALQPVGTNGSGDLQQALTALGYTGAEAVKMSQGIDAELPVEEQIKMALQGDRVGK